MHFTGQTINHGTGLGIEIPVMCHARGHEKTLLWLEKAINKILLKADDLASNLKANDF